MDRNTPLIDDMVELAEALERLNESLGNPTKRHSQSFRQQDRTLSDGRVKTATGYVEESNLTDIMDFAPDLTSRY